MANNAGAGEKAKSTIVIKRIKKGGHGHHGGAWKIAYADFVTAMMAFFLLMWLLGSTTKGDLRGIADYFQSPLQVALSGGSGAGDATSLVPGGGEGLSRDVGQLRKGENKDIEKRRRLDMVRKEQKRLQELDQKLQAAIDGNPKLSEYRNQVHIDITPDGLRVQIIDDFQRPMFDMGGTRVKDYLRDILRQIGTVLDDVDSHITLSGHTDSAPYAGAEHGYSNWELSTERANASRRELIAGGMDPSKVARVIGLADSVPLVKDDPRSPLNRRISIVVLSKLAEERMLQADREIAAGSAEAVENALDSGTATPAAAAAPAPAPSAAAPAPAESAATAAPADAAAAAAPAATPAPPAAAAARAP